MNRERLHTRCNFISKYHKQERRDAVGSRCFPGVKAVQGLWKSCKLTPSSVRVWLSVTGAARMFGRTPSDADSVACLTKKAFSTSAFSALLSMGLPDASTKVGMNDDLPFLNTARSWSRRGRLSFWLLSDSCWLLSDSPVPLFSVCSSVASANRKSDLAFRIWELTLLRCCLSASHAAGRQDRL